MTTPRLSDMSAQEKNDFDVMRLELIVTLLSILTPFTGVNESARQQVMMLHEAFERINNNINLA